MRLRHLSVSLLDLRLGVRMLFKHPGLTTVGGLALAFAIWVAAVTFEVVGQLLDPDLPLDEGDRVVAILNHDLESGRRVAPLESDHLAWKRQLGLVQDLGMFREIYRNLTPQGGRQNRYDLRQSTRLDFRCLGSLRSSVAAWMTRTQNSVRRP